MLDYVGGHTHHYNTDTAIADEKEEGWARNNRCSVELKDKFQIHSAMRKWLGGHNTQIETRPWEN